MPSFKFWFPQPPGRLWGTSCGLGTNRSSLGCRTLFRPLLRDDSHGLFRVATRPLLRFASEDTGGKKKRALTKTRGPRAPRACLPPDWLKTNCQKVAEAGDRQPGAHLRSVPIGPSRRRPKAEGRSRVCRQKAAGLGSLRGLVNISSGVFMVCWETFSHFCLLWFSG